MRPAAPLLPLVLAAGGLLAGLLAACGGEADPLPDGEVLRSARSPGPTRPATGETARREIRPGARSPAPEERAGSGVRFHDGLAAGVAAAGDPDRLLFVYVGRHHPT